MVDTLSIEEMAELLRGGDDVPPPIQSKISAIVARCRAETLAASR
jgi:hypothetical protein